MEQRSPEGMSGDPRKQGFSGQPLCRTAMGAASRGVPTLSGCAGCLFLVWVNKAGETPALPVKAAIP
jgi:hypothetical protein